MPLNVGVGEILVVLLVALVVLGPDKLPGAARSVGRTLTEVRRMSTGFQAELRDAMQQPVDGTPEQAAHLHHDAGGAEDGRAEEGDGGDRRSATAG